MSKYSKWGAYISGAFMVVMGLMKIFGDVPIFTLLENNLDSKYGIQLAFIDPQFKYVTAALELIAGALLLLGQRFKGAALSVIVIGGAILTHLFVIGISTPASSAPDAPQSPMLFIVAVASFLISLWIAKAAMSENNEN